jgi:hypothetical protein
MTDYNENSPFVEGERKEREDGYKKKVFDPKIYLNVRLDEEEKEREVRIRILPAKPGSKKISTAVHIHNMKVSTEVAKSGFKAFTCLNDKLVDESMKDPRGCPFCNEYEIHRAEAMKFKDAQGTITDVPQWKALWKEAYRLQPKIAHIVRVIDRDHEDEGVKFWRFNEWDNGKGCMDYLKEIFNTYNENAAKSQYKKEHGTKPTKEELEAYMLDENGKLKVFYDVFNIEDGHDIKLTLTHGERTKDRTEIKIMADLEETSLSDDPAQVEAWINDPKTWNDAYVVKNYDFVDVVLHGGVQVWDKEQGKYVSKEEKDEADKQSEVEAAEELRNGWRPIIETNNEDLPF